MKKKKQKIKDWWKDLKVDNGTTYVTVGKIFRNGKDITDEYFGKKIKLDGK